MTKELNRENFASVFRRFLEQQTAKDPFRLVAISLNCSIAVLNRLINQETFPSDEMLKQTACMIAIGLERYTKLSEAERRKLSDHIGPLCGGAVGFASISTAVSSLGVISGLSAAGITSGLAGLGSLAGGGMMLGVTVAAAIPVATAAAGFGVFRGLKQYRRMRRLKANEIDTRWELLEI
ncbi:MAG: hypothetical protein AAF609_16985 [Cyanobacteria bacterium P01_C01_bin.120]